MDFHLQVKFFERGIMPFVETETVDKVDKSVNNLCFCTNRCG